MFRIQLVLISIQLITSINCNYTNETLKNLNQTEINRSKLSLNNINDNNYVKDKHHKYTIDELLMTTFPTSISDDIDMNPCKSGKRMSKQIEIKCIMFVVFPETPKQIGSRHKRNPISKKLD